ncbi:MAG TPA: glycosyltransferase family 4 protein [Rudaea sp.]|nr:glycosyltransferase family 4 protein [Rudaea sp.]
MTRANATAPLRVWLPAVRAGSGADVFTERLADALRARGVDARIDWFPHWTEMAPDVLRFARMPDGTSLVHANSAYAFAFARAGVPLVVTEHHYTLDPAYRPYKSALQHLYHRVLMGPCLRRSYARAAAITTDSQFTTRVLADVAGVAATRTIPLWVDYADFSPGALREADGKFRLLFVGNASRRKGADVIPALADRLGDRFEIRCTSGLRQQMSAAPRANVHVLGRLSREELVGEYRACDAVLVPSRYEGFGYSALEAMACAKPVVGFRCGAVEEVALHDATALLYAIDDLDGLANGCRELARDAAKARAFGAAGRERAVTVFTERRAMDAYLELYESLLRRK